jgi:hypothetical protein
VDEVSQRDGVKYIMADDSWLLIRPSGTEPVLRVYAEGRTNEMVKALMGYGKKSCGERGVSSEPSEVLKTSEVCSSKWVMVRRL